MYLVHATLYTLNARNIYLEAVEPPARLNRKREKNGKIPLYRYHVLKVAPGIVRKNKHHESTQSVTGAMPIHLCRGHFRTYTEKSSAVRDTGKLREVLGAGSCQRQQAKRHSDEGLRTEIDAKRPRMGPSSGRGGSGLMSSQETEQ